MNNYIVGNVDIDGTNSTDKYSVVAISNAKEFHIPPNMNRCSFMELDDTMVEFIAQNNISELENYEYDKEQINNKISALKSSIDKRIAEVLADNTTRKYSSDVVNDDRLNINRASR